MPPPIHPVECLRLMMSPQFIMSFSLPQSATGSNVLSEDHQAGKVAQSGAEISLPSYAIISPNII